MLTGFIAVLVLCCLEEMFTDDPGRWRGVGGGGTEMVYSSYTHTHALEHSVVKQKVTFSAVNLRAMKYTRLETI